MNYKVFVFLLAVAMLGTFVAVQKLENKPPAHKPLTDIQVCVNQFGQSLPVTVDGVRMCRNRQGTLMPVVK